jgi:hypothetical protein
MSLPLEHLSQIRFEITEAARILRLSRASVYERIRLGDIESRSAQLHHCRKT